MVEITTALMASGRRGNFTGSAAKDFPLAVETLIRLRYTKLKLEPTGMFKVSTHWLAAKVNYLKVEDVCFVHLDVLSS